MGATINQQRPHAHKILTVSTIFVFLSILAIAGSITLDTPSDGDTVSGTEFFNITLGAANVTNITLAHDFNGSWTNFSNTVNTSENQTLFNISIDTFSLFNGTAFINTTAWNASGRVNWTAIQITVDNVPPNLTARTPGRGANVSGVIDINATWADSISGINNNQYRLYNGTGALEQDWTTLNATAVDSSGVDTTSLTSGDGAYTITYYVDDNGGNVNSTNRTVYVDNNAPTVSWNVPSSDWFNTQTVNLTANVTDFSGVNASNHTLYLNSSLVNLSVAGLNTAQFGNNYRFFYVNSTFTQGRLYHVNLTVSDVFGRTLANTSTTFKVDTINPNATDNLSLVDVNVSNALSSSLADTILNSTTIGFNWSGYNASNELTDSISGVDHLELWANNRSFDDGAQGFGGWNGWYAVNDSIKNTAGAVNNTTVKGLVEGYQYNFTLRAYDTADNYVDSNFVAVLVDQSGPAVARNSTNHKVYAPRNWALSGDNSITVDLTDPTGIDNESIALDITNVSSGANGWTTPLTVSLNTNAANQTVYNVSATLPTLINGQNYTVAVNASDRFGAYNGFNWTFQTDQNDPVVSIKRFNISGKGFYQGWHEDSHIVRIDCRDNDADNSGIKDAAVFYDNGTQFTDWNGTFTNLTGETGGWANTTNMTLHNFTIAHPAQETSNTYDFVCRDNAGNTANQSAQIKIDAKEPDVTGVSVEGDSGTESGNDWSSSDWEDLPTKLDVTIDLSDAGSGINKTASEEEMKDDDDNEDYTFESFSWDLANDEVTFDITGLDKGDTYSVDLTFIDFTGNRLNTDLDGLEIEPAATTEEENSGTSGGTTTTTSTGDPSVAVNDVPSSVTVNAGSDASFTVEVENDGEVALNDVDVSFDIDDQFSVSVSGDGEDMLTSGDTATMDVTITVSAPEDAVNGEYEGTLTVEPDEDTSAEETVTVTVTGGEEPVPETPSLTVSDYPTAVNGFKVNTTIIQITVENTGAADAADVAFSFDLPNTSRITPKFQSDTADITAGSSQTLFLSLVPDNQNTPIGVYTGTFKAVHSSGTAAANISVKINPADTSEKEQVTAAVETLENRFNAVKDGLNTSEVEEVEAKIASARQALENGDYAQAAAIEQELRERYQIPPHDGGFPWWMVGVGVLVLILGLLAYMIVPTPSGPYPSLGFEEDYGYTYQDETWQDRLERLQERARLRLLALKGVMLGLVNDLRAGDVTGSDGSRLDRVREDLNNVLESVRSQQATARKEIRAEKPGEGHATVRKHSVFLEDE